MTRLSLRAAFAVGLLALSATTASAQTIAADMAKAANAFIATLTPAQKQATLFAYDDAEQRKRWSNLPVNNVPRSGVKFADMTESQRGAAMALLAAAFSEKGLQKVQAIMDGDEMLKTGSANQGGGRGGRGGGANFGKDLYFFSILGTPSGTTPWMLQFGGHHLALNVTVAGAKGVLTPTLTAAQPALYELGGKTVRPLGAENDKAVTLLKALNDQQRAQVVLKYTVSDLVLGAGQDGKTIQPEGLKASALTEAQRALLLEVIAEWAGIIHEPAASARMTEIKASLNDTYFAWSGETDVAVGTNMTSYYRIQGPTLVIEFSPQRGSPTLHIHTIYRDPTNDYGRKLSTP